LLNGRPQHGPVQHPEDDHCLRDGWLDAVDDQCSVSELRIISSGLIEFVGPGVDDGLSVDVGDGGQDAIFELLFGSDPDMTRTTERASLEKKPSTRLSQEPCFGVRTKVRRPSGWVASHALVSLEMWAASPLRKRIAPKERAIREAGEEWLSRINLIAGEAG
jgi:hypothetical protein